MQHRKVVPLSTWSACWLCAFQATAQAPPTTPVPRTQDTDIRAASDSAANEDSRAKVALQTESAFGVTGEGFYNHLLGTRLDYAFTEAVSAGAYLAYGNLKGKDGRTKSGIGGLVLGYRLGLGETQTWGLPLRLMTGYVARNGPIFRLSGGFNVRLGESTDFGMDVLAPTFWVTHDETVVSMDVSAEIRFAL